MNEHVNYLSYLTFLQISEKQENSADPDLTAPREQSDLGLHCLLK